VKDLSIVIPYRPSTDRRITLFNWIYKRYEMLFPESEIIVSDADDSAIFSRSRSRNLGVDRVKSKYVLLADADTITCRRFIEHGILELDYGAGWVIPYGPRDFFVLDNVCSSNILSRRPDYNMSPSEFSWEWKLESFGGLNLMRTESFRMVNGFDERFIGWGYEDNSFMIAMNTIIGKAVRPQGTWGAHLWHPATAGETWEHDYAEYNRDMMERYKRFSGNANAMSSLVGGNR